MELRPIIGAFAGLCCMTAALTGAHADGLVDPSRAGYLDTFKGKKVAFVPIAMGFDLAQAWNSQLAKQAEELEHRGRRSGVDAAHRREAGPYRRT
jgi:hypothetical protein